MKEMGSELKHRRATVSVELLPAETTEHLMPQVQIGRAEDLQSNRGQTNSTILLQMLEATTPQLWQVRNRVRGDSSEIFDVQPASIQEARYG